MKPEPLKRKGLISFSDIHQPLRKSSEGIYFKKEDINSAVEWLKIEIGIKGYDSENLIDQEAVISLIDKAFEDAIKKFMKGGEDGRIKSRI